MKHSNLVILFIIFTIPFFILFNIKNNLYSSVVYKKAELNKFIDKAVYDSMYITLDDNAFELDRDAVRDTFYNILNINIGYDNNYFKNSVINEYIPALAFIDYDGVYIESYKDKNAVDTEYIKEWSEKVPFTFLEGNYIITFSLTENIKVFDIETGSVDEGHYSKFKDVLSFCNSADSFEEQKNKVIRSIITREVNKSINEHNKINKYYEFILPTIEESDWNNVIKDASLIAFVQNVPLVGDIVYNNYSVGGSTIYNDTKYYMIEVDGENIIHTEDCDNFDINNSDDYIEIKSLGRSIDNGAIPDDCIYE